MKTTHVLMLLLALYPIILKGAVMRSRSNKTDLQALLAFKENLNAGPNVLSSWNESIFYCQWKGVTCSRRHGDRVSEIVLPGESLVGSISPFIGNLTFLRELNLESNGLYGEIPSSFGHLRRLEYLKLYNNSLLGEFPVFLQNCSNLLTIDLSDNNLTGQIPSWIGFMPKLKKFELSLNYFTGTIPSSLANLSSLTDLFLLGNSLEGAIPYGLGQFSKIETIQLAGNFLTGSVPDSLFNSTSLSMISVAYNNLYGSLPSSMGKNLINIEKIYFGGNLFTGVIPASLSNASGIIELYLSENNFTGKIPPELGKLCPSKLVLHSNMLEAKVPEDWEFIRFLANCTRLRSLQLERNLLRGAIPNSLTNLTTGLKELRLDQNDLSGAIPHSIGNLVGLTALSLAGNKLEGTIPEGINKLYNLIMLNIEVNKLSGPIPSSIGNLTKLNIFTANQNGLEGPIPKSIEHMQQLTYLDLSDNNLTGTLPTNIFNLPLLSQVLNLSGNFLVGTIPSDIGNLIVIESLSLSRNSLSGELPTTLSKCQSLEFLELDNNLFNGSIPTFISTLKGISVLNLANNAFSGEIPEELADIKGLQILVLSWNKLSGTIPAVLGNLSLLFQLDLSFNFLEGPVPTKGVFSNISALSLQGNSKLCGGISELQLPVCILSPDRKSSHHVRRIVIITMSLIICIILLFVTYIMLKLRKRTKNNHSKHSLAEENYPKVSYHELLQATDGFAATNLIGSGRYGYVYKANLSLRKDNAKLDLESYIVAVKVFNLQVLGTLKSFIAECEVLKNIRHRNLINVITCCSSIDLHGNDFKALVFNFMPNGSLDAWLHNKAGVNAKPNLNILQRLNIAANIADALNYLHNGCYPPVVHCDIKPSNILLNEDLIAFVGDFGLAKFLCEATSNLSQDSQSIMIRGSIGYIAPEYGAGAPVSIQTDVYSFGILLLEMFTGRKPTDEMFQGGLSLHDYAKRASPTETMEIVDPSLLLELEDNLAATSDRFSVKMSKCLSCAINIGLVCSKPSPEERMSMEDAATQIHVIREEFIID